MLAPIPSASVSTATPAKAHCAAPAYREHPAFGYRRRRLAGLALVLGCVGVYGVLSFLVSRQTHDLGIRIALGAQRRDVFWLVIKEGAALCLAGVALGVIGAMALAR